jgi:FMN phosphatase YigB (HAD superfamily)
MATKNINKKACLIPRRNAGFAPASQNPLGFQPSLFPPAAGNHAREGFHTSGSEQGKLSTTFNASRFTGWTFWIDLGNVLFFFDYARFLEKIRPVLPRPLMEVKELFFTAAFVQDFERGLIAEEDFFVQFQKYTGLRIPQKDFFEGFCDIFWENTSFIRFVRDSLKGRCRLILVSNINNAHYSFLKTRYPGVFGLFDELVLSCRVNAIKPEPAIYDAALKASGNEKERIVYIDDRDELVQAALKRGIPGICFRGTESCIAELNKRGVVG